MKNNKTNDLRKQIQALINQTKLCWLCGRTDTQMLTNHHIIPQRYQGTVMNVTIPMCKNCQTIMHINDEFMALLRRLVLK